MSAVRKRVDRLVENRPSLSAVGGQLCARSIRGPHGGHRVGATRITSPIEQFGFNIGDDYKLVNYTRLLEYWKKLDQQSDRLTVVDIGRTAEGRPIAMAIVTSPENHKTPRPIP